MLTALVQAEEERQTLTADEVLAMAMLILLAGNVVGVLEVFLTSRLGYDVADPIVYSVLLVMLLLRPQGLFGRRDAVRD